MLRGGESDQGIVGRAAQDLPAGHRGEKLLVTDLGQGEEWLGEPLGREAVPPLR
jgi:hypothetical protein